MAESLSRNILIFTRYPRPGRAKTRLIPALGEAGAADLQRRMTEFTVGQARNTGARVEVRYTDGDAASMQSWLGDGLVYVGQGEGSLGERLARGFDQRFAAGARRVVAVGCDCPDNRTGNMLACFEALEQSEWAIGPAVDGGYYMLGLTRPAPELFSNIDWGGEQVLGQTLAAADSPPFFLPELRDVDRADDMPSGISVVVPALNEVGAIGDSLDSVNQGFNVECIVVDGGSADDTVRQAAAHGAKVLRSAPGRARQMNLGAAAAAEPLLLFLHADTVLPENWDRTVRQALREEKIALGAFRLRVRERMPGIAWIERGANIRSRIFRRPYGDQGLFMRLADFRRVGGYPELPIMEDVELVRRLRKGGRIATASDCVTTSGRRWRRLGVARATLCNQAVVLGYRLGVAPDRLAWLYRGSVRQ